MQQDVLNLATSTAFILALTQLVKPFVVNTKWHPHIAVGLGVLTNIALTWLSLPWTRVNIGTAVVAGMIAGMSAAGLYNNINDQDKGNGAKTASTQAVQTEKPAP